MKTVEFLIVGNGLAGTMLAFEMLEKKLDFGFAKVFKRQLKNKGKKIIPARHTGITQ